LLQAGRIGVEFQQQLQRAAAGQAEAVGLVGAHAVTHQLRRAVGNAQVLVQGLGVASDQIVFDAAARYRANGASVLAQGHHGAHGAGDEPQVRTTVASKACWPAERQSRNALSTKTSILSIACFLCFSRSLQF
jgi:hypothetical protein